MRTDDTEGADIVDDDFAAVVATFPFAEAVVVALLDGSGTVRSPLVTPTERPTGVAAVFVVAAVVFVLLLGVVATAVFVNAPDVGNIGVAVTLLAAAGAVAMPVLIIWVPCMVAAGVAIEFVIGVAVVFEIADVVAFVAPPVFAAGNAATESPPPPPPEPSPAPLTMAGVAGELIDEFTVTCGFAVADGGMNCPVTCCRLAEVLAVPSFGAAWPRYLPLKASSALRVAIASSDAEKPLAGDDEIKACGVPCAVVAPDDEPGADVAFRSPFPGILFVEQPKAASEPVSAIAATIRRPLRSFCLIVNVLRMSRLLYA